MPITHPSTSSLDFQIYPDHFEISNSSTVDTESPQIGVCSSSHNFSISNLEKMEEDCEEKSASTLNGTSPSVYIEKLFMAFTNQIANQIIIQTNSLRDEIRENELQITQDNESFQTEMRDEINALHNLLQGQQVSLAGMTSTTSPCPLSAGPGLSPLPTGSSPNISSPMISVSQGSSTNATGPQVSGDIHSQMMLMMAESFSKLSTVLSESKQDSKSDWPKFAGDSKKFRDWYLTIMTQVSWTPWNKFYDSTINDVIATTTNSTLNGKLYSS
jgi:hypothetical protein